MAMVVDSMRRWWARYGMALILSVLSVGGAFGLQHTRGEGLVELYRFLTLPFAPKDTDSAFAQVGNTELRSQVQDLQQQNEQLRQQLALRNRLGEKTIAAPVVARSADHWWQQLTLGRGSNDGIQVGDAAFAPGGLAGRVDSVTPNTSRVLLISSPTSQVGVTLTRTRAMGVLYGRGTNMAVIQFFDKEPKVQVGDAVVTSGISSLYPAGLAIGTVREIDLLASPSPEATIALTVPFEILEWVSVYRTDTSLVREATSGTLTRENLSVNSP